MDIALVHHGMQPTRAPVLAWGWSTVVFQATSSSSAPPWGDYVLLVLMTVFLFGVLVFAWKHREH
jgi:hypothetical protein